MRHAVLSDDCQPQAADQLMDAVVDLRVDVVGSAGKDDDLLSGVPRLPDDLFALCHNVFPVLLQRRKAVFQRRLHLLFGGIAAEHGGQGLYYVAAAVQVEERVQEIVVVQLFAVRHKQFRIIRHHRTVIVIVRIALVDVIAHAGVEDEVHALFQQALDMTVCQLRRIAHRI